ncbi:hypothetical protein YC2023_121201 [Brassica napus]
MGRYSYSQQSSSSASVDITSLLEAEAQGYADEAQSSFDNGEPFQNQPQPEGDDGIPTICYCGSEPVVATAYTEKDPGRRYFTCNNVVDGATHIWKWWDDAVMEEMRDFQTEIRRLKEAVAEREQKLLLLEKTVYDAVTQSIFTAMSGYRHLLYSQIPVDLESPEPFWLGSQAPDDSPSEISPRSGQNDDDVIKAAYDIFFTKYDTKFTLDHCWRELRHEQKWASTYMAKDGGKEKRRPVVDLDGPEENVVGEDEDRPVGVKAAKGASKKKKSGRDEELSKLQGVLELKEKLSRNKVLDRLLAKKEPLSEIETTLKMKLMSEML